MRAPLVAPPSTAEALLARARGLGGRTVGEVAAEFGIPVPNDQRRAKGLVGNLMERALGATAGSTDAPDFVTLGIELKTIPVDLEGKPRESTFVCTVPMEGIGRTEWADSRVRRKLRCVLWVPVESLPELALPDRRIGAPILWTPNAEQEKTLREDWDELAGVLGSSSVEQLTARTGQVLQVRPKAAHSRVRTPAMDADEGPLSIVPRGFYLRATFTAQIVASAFRPG